MSQCRYVPLHVGSAHLACHPAARELRTLRRLPHNVVGHRVPLFLAAASTVLAWIKLAFCPRLQYRRHCMRVFRRIAVTLAIALSSAVFSHADERESARKLLENTVFNPEFRP